MQVIQSFTPFTKYCSTVTYIFFSLSIFTRTFVFKNKYYTSFIIKTMQEDQATADPEISTEDKNIAIIAYLTFIGLIIAIIMNNNGKAAFSSYHIRQSLGLNVTGLSLGVIGMVPILGWIVSVLGSFVLLYMWVIGLMNAINGKPTPCPILGEKYQEWFRNFLS